MPKESLNFICVNVTIQLLAFSCWLLVIVHNLVAHNERFLDQLNNEQAMINNLISKLEANSQQLNSYPISIKWEILI